MLRLQKFLSEAGVASRRAGEEIITAGRVSVNGVVTAQLGVKVDPDTDIVKVDGRVVRPKRKLYVALHKPRGYLSSRRADSNRPTLYELLPKEWSNLFTVGRLDLDSEGLIFLTNDGQFCLELTHPRYGIRKTYVAVVEGRVDREMLSRFTRGIYDHGEKLIAKKARLISANNSASLVEIELAEGKNREVRRLFESQGLNVERLKRIRIGSIKLGELPSGKWRALTEPEIKSLLPKL
jgi:23S rRNA pseudouridine2605 synthase